MAELVYLRLRVQEGHEEQMERDLRAALKVAEGQPGFRWAQFLRDLADPSAFVVLSEWRDQAGIDALESNPEYRRIVSAESPYFRGKVETLRYRSG